MLRSIVSALVGSIASVALAAGADAAVLQTQTQAASASGSALTFKQYAGPGTLTAVTVDFSFGVEFFGYATNGGKKPDDFSVSYGVNGTDSTQPGAPAALLPQYDVAEARAEQTFPNLGPGETRFSAFDTATKTLSAAFTRPADLSGFAGNADFSFIETFYLVAIDDYGPGGIAATSGSPPGFTAGYFADGASVTVTYDGMLPPPPTSPVPEPSALAAILTGFGMLGIGAVRRRR